MNKGIAMREQIAQAIMKVLKTVDSLGLVTRDTVKIEDLAATSFPCALIEARDETREVIAFNGPSDVVRSTLAINLALWTQTPYQDTKRNNLFDKIESALNADRKLNGLVEDVIVREIRIEPQRSGPYGESSIAIEVAYCYNR
jgi:hypothetical protein